MFYEITLSVLLVALVVVSFVALSLRRKFRAINVFGEKSTVRSAYRDMLELLIDAAGLSSLRDTIEQIVNVQEQILRISRLKAEPAEHIVRDLQERVRQLAAVDTLPEGWSLALIRGLDGQLNHNSADWTLKALTAWRDELYTQLRAATTQRTSVRERVCA